MKLNTWPFAVSPVPALARTFGMTLIAIATLSGIVAHADIVLGGTGTNTGPAPFNLDSYVGQWGGFSAAVPIAPDYFITANHVNGGSTFYYNNGTSTTTAYTVQKVAVQDDLAIYQIVSGGHFSLYAPLFTTGNMLGQNLVSIGDGVQRGSAVTGGWDWQGAGTITTNSWGTNTVAGIIPDYTGAPAHDQFLYFDFNKTVDGQGNITDPNEAILAGNDSGGPTFVYNPADGQYELGGINDAVDSVSSTYDYNSNLSGPPPGLALYDARGYYYDSTGSGIYDTLITGTAPVPLSSYSIDIQSHLSFIASTLGSEFPASSVPEPGNIALLTGLSLTGIAFASRRRKSLLSS